MNNPDFKNVSAIEEEVLKAQLRGIRFSIAHAGEKGRALEYPVRSLIRRMLPPEYGLTTGFVAWTSPEGTRLSPQLDLIIYDAIRHAPLVHLETCDVMPLESVYGYVEVKANIRSCPGHADDPPGDSLEACVRANGAIRRMRTRHFLVTYQGSPMSIEEVSHPWLALRAYVVAFEAQGSIGGSADAFAVAMADALRKQGNAHVHGILVPNHGFFYTRAIDPQTASADDYFHVRYTTDHPLLAFRSVLLHGLASFQRAPTDWAPALDKYFQHDPQWAEQVPSKGGEEINVNDQR